MEKGATEELHCPGGYQEPVLYYTGFGALSGLPSRARNVSPTLGFTVLVQFENLALLLSLLQPVLAMPWCPLAEKQKIKSLRIFSS